MTNVVFSVYLSLITKGEVGAEKGGGGTYNIYNIDLEFVFSFKINL